MARSAADSPQGHHGQEPILLLGFDRREQLDLDFNNAPFGPAWFRKMYTADDVEDEVARDHHRSREAVLREVRYGNNITLLFRVCYYCSSYYATPNFWSAISNGFSPARPEFIRSVHDTLLRARKVYRQLCSTTVSSGATRAADAWIDFLDGQGDPMRWSIRAHPDDDGVFAKTNNYFQNAKTRYLQWDSAKILHSRGRTQLIQDTPQRAPKRSRSPPLNRAEASPCAKRRPGQAEFHRPGARPADAGSDAPALPSLKTEQEMLGAARPALHTPTSAVDPSKRDQSSPWIAPSDPVVRIRGCANQDTPLCPSAEPELKEATAQEGISYQTLEAANGLLRERIDLLEKQKLDLQQKIDAQRDLTGQNGSEEAQKPETQKAEAQTAGAPKANTQFQDDDATMKIRKTELASFEKRLADAEAQSDIRGMIACLEKRLAETEVQRVEDAKNAKATIASLESKLSLAADAGTIPKLQVRVASLEADQAVKSMPPGPTADVKALQDTQTRVARLEQKLAAAEAKATRNDLSTTHGLQETLASLVQKVTEIDPYLIKASFRETWTRIQHAEDRLAAVETKAAEGERVRELESRIAALEHLKDRLSKSAEEKDAATQAFEACTRKLYERLAMIEDRVDSSSSLTDTDQRSLRDRLAILEMQAPRLVRTVETPKTPKSPSPLQDTGLQRSMEDMVKKIKSLPGLMSEKVFQVEKNIRDMLNKYQRDTNARLDETAKDLEAAQARIKGLNSLLNETKMLSEATADKRDSIKALESEVAILSKRLDTATQNQPQNGEFVTLRDKVEALGTQLGDTTPAELSSWLQEVHSRIDGIQKVVEGIDAKAAAADVASLHNQVDVLTAHFKALLQHLHDAVP